MDEGWIKINKIEESIQREEAGIIEKKTRADPEGRVAGKVDIIFALEKLPEIINAGANDQQTTQGIGHGLEPGFLDKENIDG
jgi:hypothetical protein